MEWTDDAIVLAARPQGENSLILSLLTRRYGRHAGLVRGGARSRSRSAYEPGSRVVASWRARLSEHLGMLSIDLVESHAAGLLDDPLRLACLASATAVTETVLPEREPHGPVHDGLVALLRALDTEDSFGAVYVAWELGLLAELGFGLDLAACAATGRNDNLAYVSPRTGRAVSLSAGEPFRDRLLALPGFLLGRGSAEAAAVLQGLELTGHFLSAHVFHAQHRGEPAARARFIERMRALATKH